MLRAPVNPQAGQGAGILAIIGEATGRAWNTALHGALVSLIAAVIATSLAIVGPLVIVSRRSAADALRDE